MTSKRSYILALLGAAAFIGCAPFAWQSAKAAAPEIETLFLEAEQNPDLDKAIDTLKLLLQRPETTQEGVNPVFSAAHIKALIVEDYLRLYKKERDVDHLEGAKAFVQSDFENGDRKAWAYAHVLGAISGDPAFKKTADVRRFASSLVDEIETETKTVTDGETRERLYYTLAVTLTRTLNDQPVFGADELSLVHNYISQITTPARRMLAMRRLAVAGKNIPGAYPKTYASLYELMQQKDLPADSFLKIYQQAVASDDFDLAVTSLMLIKDKDDRTDELTKYFHANFDKGEISRARRIAEKIETPGRAADLWSELGGHYLIKGYVAESVEAYKKADEFAAKIEKSDSRSKTQKMIEERKARDNKKAQKKSENASDADKALADKALKAFEKDGIVAAVTITKTIQEPVFRAKTFRKLAEQQTKLNDKYGMLEETGNERPVWRTLKDKKIVDLDQGAVDKFEAGITAKMGNDPSDLAIFEGLPSSIGRAIPHDPLVERLKANGDTIREMIPLPGEARVTRSYYENNLYNSKFYEVFGNAGFTGKQKTAAPEAIVIETGTMDLPALYDYLRDTGYGDYMTRQGKVYLLKRPVVIGPRAALVVTGDDVEALRLSTEFGAYLVISGKLYISDSKLVGWNDSKNEPMWTEYKDKRNFRPYFTAWSQGQVYIGNSEIVALGYGNGKSYGLAWSAGPNIWFKYGNDKHASRPTGIMADNSIRNTLYGFYSYEADDVVLSGNEYVDNVVYGVDPHDRSERLAIGYNTAYYTHKKHGIIISREVNDSLIFGNLTFENKGTGIMLDRDSNGTLVYGNTTFHNKQDGMTLFESDCEIVAANKVFENNASGFRIRNSYNVGLFNNDIHHNKSAAVLAYEGTLKGNPMHKTRDFDLDPYDELTGVTVVGNNIESNGGGLGVEIVGGMFIKENKFVNQSPKIVRGALFKGHADMLFRNDQEKLGVSVNATCPSLVDELYVQSCKFRENGTLRGDGMDKLTDRIKVSQCAKSTTTTKKPYIEVDDEIEE